MISKKLITRVIIYFILLLLIASACFLYYFGDINKLKNRIEKNLKDQLTCTIKLGQLDWDWDGLKLGVTTSEISLYDKENNLVLQAGPSRAVWHLKHIITGNYSHFYKIESTNLYLNIIRDKKGIWNLVAIFPPGPPPKVDNLNLNNSIVYLIDELIHSDKKAILYKDLNLNWQKARFSKYRTIHLVTRVGSVTSFSFLKINGKYTEDKKFHWNKSELDLALLAKRIDLSNWQGYIHDLIKEPEIKKLSGEFTGKLRLKKQKKNKQILLRLFTKTNNFIVAFQNKGIAQTIVIPKTDLTINAFIEQNKLYIKSLKSNIEELNYALSGYIYNWSKSLPEADLKLKTNKFNFKSVKPFLPLSLLPADTRARIEPLNDNGFVEIDLSIKGPAIAPRYYGNILLDDFNLTSESGFLTTIKGVKGKLTLEEQILKIDYLNIPIENSLLVLTGQIDNEKLITSFNIKGEKLNVNVLQDLIFQCGFKPNVDGDINSEGRLDLNLDVLVDKDTAPQIKGQITFQDTGVSILTEGLLEIKNVIGELSLDGAKIIFKKLSGLINNENFSINGNVSLKEDEAVSLYITAEHLKIIRYLLSLATVKTPYKLIAETVSGEFSNLDLNIAGTLIKPILDGMVLINKVSFNLPNLADKISNISGNLKFEGSELIIEELNGRFQDSDFGIAGYISDLFTYPKPKLRLVTGDINIGPLWNYIKDQLKTSSLGAQADALEKLDGLAAVDLFLHPDALLGNVYFKDGQIKYKTLPFSLNKLAGRLVIGEKNLSLFDLMGAINNSNEFNSNLIVYNYLNPSFYIQGMLTLDLNIPEALKAINGQSLDKIVCDGLIPTTVDFDISLPLVSCFFYSTLNEMLQVELPPYIRKPTDKAYSISGNIDFDSEKMNLYLNKLNINSNKLSLTTTGSIKNISSKDPDIMLYFNTDEPAAIFMIIEPVIPLMGLKIWGMIDLSGSISGTPTMYSVSSNATIKDIRMPDLLGKKLTASNGAVSFYLDNEQGVLNSKLNNINFVSLNAKSVSLSANYLNPVIYLNEFSLDGDPGNVFAVGSYDPRNGSISLSANGSSLELTSLGSFIFLDPEKISGMTNFSVMLDAQGKTKEELLSNAKGDLLFSAENGKLGEVALLQKGIQFANLVKQGIFGFNITNIFSIFFKYQDGSFNNINGKMNIDKGIVKVRGLHYKAKDLFLNSFGFIDLINSFIGLSFYGYIPEKEQNAKNGETNIVKGTLSIIPESFQRVKIIIPFLHITPPRHFKFEVKGNLKDQRKITRRAARSFKWLRGKRLQKEYKFVPKT